MGTGALLALLTAVPGGTIYDVSYGEVPNATGWFETIDGALDDGIITDDEVIDWQLALTGASHEPKDHVWWHGHSYGPPCDPATLRCDDELDWLAYIPGELLQYHVRAMWHVDAVTGEHYPAAVSLVLDDYGQDGQDSLIYAVDSLGAFQMQSVGQDASQVIAREVPEPAAMLLILVGMSVIAGRRRLS